MVERLCRLAIRTRSLSGWRRCGLAAVLGGGAAAAMPPVGAVPLLVIAFSGLACLLDGAGSYRAAFVTGWWFGSGFFTAGLYWVTQAFLVDSEQFAWLIPFALSVLAAGLALFTGLATWLAAVLSYPGLQRGVALAGTWTVSEMVRGTLFGGFPWNLLAYTWTSVDAMMQPAAVVGAYGMSLLTVLVATAPAALTDLTDPREATRVTRGVGWGAAVLLPLVLWGAGAGRLDLAGLAATQPMVEGVRLRLVQPNTPQSLRWTPGLRASHFLHQIEMSASPGFDKITHVIWPETASAFSLDWHEEARRLVAKVAPPGGAVLTGVLRTTPPASEPARFWNSLMVIDHEGSVAAFYDKAHLVPFGEFVPLRKLLPLPKIIVGSTDFSSGPGRQTMHTPGLPPVSPLICYEVIFPGAVVEQLERPQWMLNVTNDAWFGLSAGPHQHFASARWRAVEQGIPLVRVAVTGISGVVDSYGRVVESLSLGIAGVRDVPLPVALPKPPPFARWGNTIAAVLAVVCLGTALALKYQRQRNKSMVPKHS